MYLCVCTYLSASAFKDLRKDTGSTGDIGNFDMSSGMEHRSSGGECAFLITESSLQIMNLIIFKDLLHNYFKSNCTQKMHLFDIFCH